MSLWFKQLCPSPIDIRSGKSRGGEWECLWWSVLLSLSWRCLGELMTKVSDCSFAPGLYKLSKIYQKRREQPPSHAQLRSWEEIGTQGFLQILGPVWQPNLAKWGRNIRGVQHWAHLTYTFRISYQDPWNLYQMPEADADKNWVNFRKSLRYFQIEINVFGKMYEAEVWIKIAGLVNAWSVCR